MTCAKQSKLCAFDGCTNPAPNGRLCAGHVNQRRRGTELKPLHLTHRPAGQSLKWLIALVSQRPWPNACVPWPGGYASKGYGATFWKGSPARAHRVAYTLAYGECPEGLCVLHSCDNPACVNPAHLRAGTNKDNVADRKNRGRSAAGERSGARLHPDRWKRGEDINTAKLTADMVRLARERFEGGVTVAQLAQEFGVGHFAMGRAVRRVTWRHVE